MEIDPAALSRSTTNPDVSATPSASSKTLPGSSKDAQKSSKTTPTAPRVDLEPFYIEIKAAIGDQWTVYKDALAQFILGWLNQHELSKAVESILVVDPHRENLHNQLVCGIYANVLRDPPDSAVAPWVSANDKPTNVPKAPTGDAADQALKMDIMKLPPRMRHRIKAIKDEPHKPLTTSLLASAQALTYHQTHANPSSTAMEPHSSSSTTTGLNRDLDIRRRYQQTLISEAHDLPSPSGLNDRILPICYEEGLASGLANGDVCSDLLSLALGIFVKDFLTGIVARTRCNAPVSGPKPDATISPPVDGPQVAAPTYGNGLDRTSLGIMTGSYRKRLKEEERLWEAGEIKRSDAGLLPVEVQSAHESGRGKSAPGDLRMAWELGDPIMRALAPWQGEKIVMDGEYRWSGEGSMPDEDGDGRRLPDGIAPARGSDLKRSMTNGHAYDAMEVDDDDCGWPGARPADQLALTSLLSDCLNIEY